jgi:hypothetical protein
MQPSGFVCGFLGPFGPGRLAVPSERRADFSGVGTRSVRLRLPSLDLNFLSAIVTDGRGRCRRLSAAWLPHSALFNRC